MERAGTQSQIDLGSNPGSTTYHLVTSCSSVSLSELPFPHLCTGASLVGLCGRAWFLGDVQQGVAVNWGPVKLEREQAFAYCSLLTVHVGPAVPPNQPPRDAPLHLREGDQEESLTPLLKLPRRSMEQSLPCPPGPAGHSGARRPSAIPCASNVAQPEENGNLL